MTSSRYDTTHVFTLDAFEHVFKVTHYNNALLKHEALISTIMSCFSHWFVSLHSFEIRPSSISDSCIPPHNATKSLLNYVNILKNLKNQKGVAFHYVKYVVRSMVGFVFNVTYKESNKT